MKFLIYSDLHLEHVTPAPCPDQESADVLVLAGDITHFDATEILLVSLNKLLTDWKKPVFYVAGNHEYYTGKPMNECREKFVGWLKEHHPHVHLLHNEAYTLDNPNDTNESENVHVFGGTMWTDFNNRCHHAMWAAARYMNDYNYIKIDEKNLLSPAHTIDLHEEFRKKLISWFENTELKGPRVVITHHAPLGVDQTRIVPHKINDLSNAFVCTDMAKLIEKYQPDLWIYGHTHQVDDQWLRRTHIVSNPRGYPKAFYKKTIEYYYECINFDERGKLAEVW